jgi:putative ubiquitin-RnfH superfamily antitoxin RatB of RatAB toxin-antitoxin module
LKLRISVAVALPGRQEVVELRLEEGATIADALEAAQLRNRFPDLRGDEAVGIWSRTCSRDTLLRDGDRVEVYRALRADPKAMRRARARVKPASPRSRNAR